MSLREDNKNAGVIINVLIGTNGHMPHRDPKTNGHMPYRDPRRGLSQQFIMMCYFHGDFFLHYYMSWFSFMLA